MLTRNIKGISFRALKKLLICTLMVFIFVGAFSGKAFAEEEKQVVTISNIFVGGFLDPHNEALIMDTLGRAEDNGVTLYVIQLDSIGIAGANIDRIAKRLSDSEIVTSVWVGPTSASYSNELDPLLASVDFVGAANKSLGKKAGTEIIAPSLREFYAKLDDQRIDRLNFQLNTGCSKEEIKNKIAGCEDIELNGDEKFKLLISPTFEKLSPISNLGHSLVKPSFAVGILVMGLFLLAFEFFAASVGVAAVAGTICSLCGIYGLGYLPTQWWAVAIVVFGVLALVIDVQAGGVGLYTVAGALSIFFGSFFAVERTGEYSVSVLGAIVITVMALLFSVGAIPSLIRTRFGTPTIGREDFIGEEGIADGDIDPEGNVKLRGGSWKARTNQATPIKDGEKCRITKIEGIVLEVEPLVGAAKDYRK